MPFTEFCCRSGGSNLYAGTLDGAAEPSTTPLVSYADGGFNSGTGVFTPASGNPSSAGVVAGQWASVYPTPRTEPFSGASGTVPTGWSTRWDGGTWTEEAGGYVRITTASSDDCVIASDTFTAASSVEVVCRVRSSLNASSQTHCGVATRGSATAGLEVGHLLYLRDGTTLSLSRLSGSSTLIVVGSASFAYTANTWYWLKFRVDGTNSQGKAWLDGTSEPAGWMVSAASTLQSGWVGLYARQTGGTYDFDDFSVTPTTTPFVARVTASSSTTLTLSTTLKSGTAPTTAASGLTATVGGAWAGPSVETSFPFNFAAATMTADAASWCRVNVRNDQTYNTVFGIGHGVAGPIAFQGYASAYGDGGRAVVNGPTTGASFVLLTLSGGRASLGNFEFANNGTTGSSALLTTGSNSNRVFNCVFHDARGAGCLNTATNYFIDCEAYACNAANSTSAGGFASSGTGHYLRCVSHDNVGSFNTGFLHTGGFYIQCIADSNGWWGFISSSGGGTIYALSCTAYNNAAGGISSGGNGGGVVGYMENNLLVNNTGYGINVGNGGGNQTLLRNNAFYNNSSGQVTSTAYTDVVGSITLSGVPFVDAANGDFRLNNAAGAGAACRAVARGNFTQTQSGYAGTTNYPDVGAVQHQDVGGSNVIVRRAASR